MLETAERGQPLLLIEPIELLTGLVAAARYQARAVKIDEGGRIEIFGGDGHEPERLLATLRNTDVFPAQAWEVGGVLNGTDEQNLQALANLLDRHAESPDACLRQASSEQLLRAALGALVVVQYAVMR